MKIRIEWECFFSDVQASYCSGCVRHVPVGKRKCVKTESNWSFSLSARKSGLHGTTQVSLMLMLRQPVPHHRVQVLHQHMSSQNQSQMRLLALLVRLIPK